MRECVIFAIDNDGDLHTVAKFMRHMDELRAMGKLKGSYYPCIGSYKGDLEHSYLVSSEDFEAHVLPSGYVDNQESFLRVETGHKDVQYASLDFWGSGVPLGRLRSVRASEALSQDAWTYRPDLGIYWVTEK